MAAIDGRARSASPRPALSLPRNARHSRAAPVRPHLGASARAFALGFVRIAAGVERGMKRNQIVILALLLAFSCKAERMAPPEMADVQPTRGEVAQAAAPPTPAGKAPAQQPAIPRLIIRNAQMTL